MNKRERKGIEQPNAKLMLWNIIFEEESSKLEKIKKALSIKRRGKGIRPADFVIFGIVSLGYYSVYALMRNYFFETKRTNNKIQIYNFMALFVKYFYNS